MTRRSNRPKAHVKDVDFAVVLEPDPDGGYAVSVPALPGCLSQGDTVEESLKHIKEAIEGYLELFGLPDPPIVVEHVHVPAA